jgi:predicted transport protein
VPIYNLKGKKLIPIREKRIDLEKTVQGIVELNLTEVFGLTFVSSEFALNSLRIDTLGFDEEQKSFVIIEYKKDRSFSVIDQGYAYLALLLNNKADFILEYNEKCKKNLRKDDVDWSQSRVVFIASSFTKYQQEAMGFQDLPISLWEVKPFEDDLILFNELSPSEKNESIKTVAKGKEVDLVTREIKQYSVEDHIRTQPDNIKGLYEELSQQLFQLDPRIEVRPVKTYIGFRLGNKNLVNVRPKKTKISIELLRTQPQDLNDPEKQAKYFENSFEYYNQHVSLVDVENSDDINYLMMLIRQIYKKHFA